MKSKCENCKGKGEWENHEDSVCQFERCSSCNGTGKASEASLNTIYNELQKEAYDIEHHVYDYKITNQIIRKRFEYHASKAVADREKEIGGEYTIKHYPDYPDGRKNIIWIENKEGEGMGICLDELWEEF